MLRHIVLFRLEPPATRDSGERLLAELERMRAEIPDIASWSTGWNVSGRGTFHIALVSDFVDQAALERYSAHPAHLHLVNEVLPGLVDAQREVADFAFGEDR